jgi:serine/threonine protein kinase
MVEESKDPIVVITNTVSRGRDSENHKMLNQYVIGKELGTGSYGKVKLCSSGGMQYAIKIFNKGILRRKKEFVK